MLHRHAIANTRVLFLDHTDSQDASCFYGCRPEAISNMGFVGRGFTGCGKTQSAVILSEAKNLSLVLFLDLNRREILRFAQNDKTRHFFRSLFSRDIKTPRKYGL